MAASSMECCGTDVDVLHCKNNFVPAPTYCRLQQKITTQFAKRINFLCSELEKFLRCNAQHQKLLSEAKLLGIFIANRCNQLRRSKSLQLLKRVNVCLRRALNFNVGFSLSSDLLQDLKNAYQGKAESRSTSLHTGYLPVQQSWTYLLWLMMCQFELLQVTMQYCCTAFQHISCEFASGNLIPPMMLYMALLSRIWQLSKVLGEQLRDSYSNIHKHRDLFERSPSNWENPTLPSEIPEEAHTNNNIIIQEKELVSWSETVSKLDSEVKPEDEQRLAGESETVFDETNTQKSAVSALNIDCRTEDFGVVLKRKTDSPPKVVPTKKKKTENYPGVFIQMENVDVKQVTMNATKKLTKKEKKVKTSVDDMDTANILQKSDIKNKEVASLETTVEKKKKKKIKCNKTNSATILSDSNAQMNNSESEVVEGGEVKEQKGTKAKGTGQISGNMQSYTITKAKDSEEPSNTPSAKKRKRKKKKTKENLKTDVSGNPSSKSELFQHYETEIQSSSNTNQGSLINKNKSQKKENADLQLKETSAAGKEAGKKQKIKAKKMKKKQLLTHDDARNILKAQGTKKEQERFTKKKKLMKNKSKQRNV